MINLVIFALIAAIALSLTNILIHKCPTELDEYIISWGKYFFALPLLWISLFVYGFPEVGKGFWLIVSFMIPLEIIISLLVTISLRSDNISDVIPFTSFTPLFVAISAFILLGERLTSMLLLVIVCFVIGTYILNIERRRVWDILAPFGRVLNHREALLMLLACVLIGVTVSLGKMAIVLSSPPFFSAVYFSLFIIVFTPIVLVRNGRAFKTITNHISILFLIGGLNGFYFITGWLSTMYGPVALANALASTNVLFTLVVAGTFWREKGIIKRLVGSAVILLGALLVIASTYGYEK